jgi:hypothetical protein
VLELIPISALAGDNLVQRSTRMPWYRGPTVAERLQALEPVPTPAFTRAVVQLDSDDDGWTALHVLSGEVRPGEVLVTWPERGEVRVLETTPFSARLARPLRRGTLLTSPDAPAQVSSRVTLIATWLGPAPREETLVLLQHGRKTNARAPGLSEPVEDGPTVALELDLEHPTRFDRWDDSPLTASCLLLDARGRTVGGGRFT